MIAAEPPRGAGFRRRRVAWATAVCALAFFGLNASGALAVRTRIAGGRVVGIAPRPSAARAGLSPSLSPGILSPPFPAPVAQTEPVAQHFTQDYENLVTQFLTDVAADSGNSTNVYSVVAQYGDSRVHPDNTSLKYKVNFSASDVFSPSDPYPPDQAHGNAAGCLAPTSVPAGDPPYTWCLTDAQIQQELSSVIDAQGLPSDLSAIYFVLLPPGVDVCMSSGAQSTNNLCADTSFCAYHASFHSGTAASAPLYAVLPYAGVSGCEAGEAPNGDLAADSELSLLSHEHNETISDPLGTGWYDSSDLEVADKCANPGGAFGTPLGGSPGIDGAAGTEYNQVINSDHYYVQDEFANEDGSNRSFDGCEQHPGAANDGVSSGATSVPATYHGGPVVGAHTAYAIFWDPASAAVPESPSATFNASSSTAHVGQEVTFTASVSNPSGGTLSYAWDFGDGASTLTSVPSATHAYSLSGSHTVTLTVTSAGVTSQPAQQTIYVFQGPTVSFTAPTRSVLERVAIAFNASATVDPDGTITSWTWRFGDGTGATGPVVSHSYAAPGAYKVTLTVDDSNGSAAMGAATIHVVAPTFARMAKTGRASVILRGGRVVLRSGRALRCGPGGACTASVTLTTRVAVAPTSGRRTAIHMVTIGTVLLVVPGGRTARIAVNLNRLGVALLRAVRRLYASIVISARTPGASTTRARFVAAVIAPAGLPPP